MSSLSVASSLAAQGGPIPTTVGELLRSYGALVGRVVAFVLALLLVWTLGRLLVVPLVGRLVRQRGFDATVQSLSTDVTSAVVFVLALGLAFTVAGFGSVIAAFGTVAGALSLALGFAAQDLLSNFVAGVFILKDEPFEVGDWVKWNDRSGRVEDIDLRVSRIRTFDNERVTVPNSELAGNAVTNPVAYDSLRQRFAFGVGYDEDISRVRSVVLEEAAANPEILSDPEPTVHVTELGDAAVELEAHFWIADPSRANFVATRSDFVQSVKERLGAETIDVA